MAIKQPKALSTKDLNKMYLFCNKESLPVWRSVSQERTVRSSRRAPRIDNLLYSVLQLGPAWLWTTKAQRPQYCFPSAAMSKRSSFNSLNTLLKRGIEPSALRVTRPKLPTTKSNGIILSRILSVIKYRPVLLLLRSDQVFAFSLFTLNNSPSVPEYSSLFELREFLGHLIQTKKKEHVDTFQNNTLTWYMRLEKSSYHLGMSVSVTGNLPWRPGGIIEHCSPSVGRGPAPKEKLPPVSKSAFSFFSGFSSLAALAFLRSWSGPWLCLSSFSKSIACKICLRYLRFKIFSL